MTTIHDFIKVLHEIIEETFPNTERYIISGGDYISDYVMELREGDKKLRYSPYELYCKSTAYEDTIEEFVSQWKEIPLKTLYLVGGVRIMRYRYECELKFIVSHFKDDNGVVTAWDYTSFKRDLYAGFKALGLNYFITVPIKEVIEGYEYEAELIAVYCSEMLEQVFVKEFQDICCKYHKEIGISTFYYSQNGILISLEIGGD